MGGWGGRGRRWIHTEILALPQRFFFGGGGIFQGAMLSRLTAEEEKAERLAPLLPRRQVPHAANLVCSPAPKSSDALRAKTRRRRREGNQEGAVGVFDFLEVVATLALFRLLTPLVSPVADASPTLAWVRIRKKKTAAQFKKKKEKKQADAQRDASVQFLDKRS